MAYAKVSEVKAGDKLKTDGGFTCMPEGVELEVKADDVGKLFVECEEGQHFLDGQLDDGDEYIGLTKV